jgi:hypothetical protein
MSAYLLATMRLGRVAIALAAGAVLAFIANYLGAVAHCDDSGCGDNFPEWLYFGSGWAVLGCLAGLVCVAIAAAVRHVLRPAGAPAAAGAPIRRGYFLTGPAE